VVVFDPLEGVLPPGLQAASMLIAATPTPPESSARRLSWLLLMDPRTLDLAEVIVITPL
jgi:hypothetical protein